MKEYQACLAELAESEANELRNKAMRKKRKILGKVENRRSKEDGMSAVEASQGEEDWETLDAGEIVRQGQEKENKNEKF